MKIKIGLITALTLLFGLMAIGIISLTSYQKELLLSSRFEQLTSIRESLKRHTNSYQDNTTENLSLISQLPSTITALQQLSSSFYQQKYKQDITVIDAELLQFYENNYLNKIHHGIPNAEKLRSPRAYIPLSDAAKIAQYQYILNKENREAPSPYQTIHTSTHKQFEQFLKAHGFYDIFLIDVKGNIVYSVMKEPDFATNLYTGPYQNSGLANAFTKSIKRLPGEISFSSFLPYEPSFNVPAAFLAMPIHSNGELLGSVAIQIPVEPINKIMTFDGQLVRAGLGNSGEAYIVGSDHTMRNNSRFINDIDSPLIKELKTTVGIQHVETGSVEAGLEGKDGNHIINDYRGVPVLSSYEPYQLFGEQTVLIAELDKHEVLEDINHTVEMLIYTISSVLLTLLIAFTLFFKQLIIQPFRKLNILLEKELRKQTHQAVVSKSLLNEYKKAVDESAIVSKTDPRGRITYVNDAFCEISGYSAQELLSSSHSIIRHPETPPSLFKDLWKTIHSKKTWKGIIQNRAKNGDDYYVSSTIVPILDIDDNIQEFMAIRTDITEIFRQQQIILNHTTDNLTGLPNRQKLLDDLTEMDKPILALINIDRFSEANNFYGNDIGDLLLIKFSERLKESFSDILVYRLTGDEFAILTSTLSENELETLCADYISSLENNVFHINEYEINVSATVGLASMIGNVYVNAGMALRVAKESRQALLFYTSKFDLQKRSKENMEWTKKIKRAIEDDRIVVFIQPIIDRRTGQINKYECLMRLIDVDGKEISPFFFLEIAKYARLYPQLTEIMINKSFSYFSDRTESFSINLTIEDILNPKTRSILTHKLQTSSIAHRLVLEIVESEGIENYNDVFEFIEEMKEFGCRIAIDDFGTGYSNFEYLMKLAPDFVKIDGSIIKNIAHDESAQKVVSLITEFSKNIGAQTIAEFVCDQSVYEQVDAIGVDYFQGYYLGKPSLADKSITSIES